MAEDYEDYQGELEVIDEGDDYSGGNAAPSDSITPVIIILTTIFTVIGMLLIGWELISVYDGKGDPGQKDNILFNINIYVKLPLYPFLAARAKFFGPYRGWVPSFTIGFNQSANSIF